MNFVEKYVYGNFLDILKMIMTVQGSFKKYVDNVAVGCNTILENQV